MGSLFWKSNADWVQRWLRPPPQTALQRENREFPTGDAKKKNEEKRKNLSFLDRSLLFTVRLKKTYENKQNNKRGKKITAGESL